MAVIIFKDKALSDLTGEMHFTDVKVMLCGIQLESFNKEKILFDYNLFEEILNNHVKKLPQIEEYKEHLWKFGHCLHIDKEDYEQRPAFQTAIDLLEKYKFLTNNKTLEIKVIDKIVSDKNTSFDNEKYIKALENELADEIREKGINKFLYNITKGKKEIVFDKEKIETDAETSIEEFSLERADLIEKKIEQLKYWREKSGEKDTTKPVKRVLHMGVNALLLLLRIDQFLEKKGSVNSIDTVKVSNKMCNFVNDFLVYFKIGGYEYSHVNSKAYTNIRDFFLNPPKITNPLLFKEIEDVKVHLNHFVKNIKW